MKLQQLREKVRNRAGIATGDQFITPQVIDDAINQAVFQIDAEYRWPWLEATQTVTLVADQVKYALPSDFDATRSILLNTANQASVVLYEVSSTVALAQDTASTGQPVGFAISQGFIVLIPTPDAGGPYTLTHLYYRMSAELVADSDEPLIHDQYHPAVVAAAASLIAAREEQRSIKEACDLDVAQWIRRMRGAIRQSTGPVVPRVRPGGWL